MTNIYGNVVEVATANVGENVTANAAIGATSIFVEDPTTFDETGGNLKINGSILPYSGIDESTGAILLGVPLDVTVEQDDRVEIYPARPVKTALVDLGIEGSDPVLVTVPHSLSAILSDGMREEGVREQALLAERSVGDLYMANIEASPAIIDSGWVSVVSEIVVAASNWSVSSANLRRIGKMINFQFNFTRTGGTFTVVSSGNIVSQHIATMVEEWRPGIPYSQIGLCSGRTGPMAVYSMGGTIDGDGEVLMCAIEPAAGDILTNDAFSVGGTYFQL
jgi:hypothetical protein